MKKLSERDQDQYGTDRGADFYKVDIALPKNMMVELSNACNHSCIFCTNPHMTRKAKRIISDLLYRVLQHARQEGVEEIGFYTTGDPFIHKDLDKFTRRAKELGFRYIYISTNGALATPERAKSVIDAGMDSIKFSINAGSRETYKLIHGDDDWDKVMKHLKFISEYRKSIDRALALFVTCVITNPMRHEVDTFKRFITPYVDEVTFVECGIQSGQMTSAQALLSGGSMPPGVQNSICPMPFNRLHVTCEGYLTLCCVDYQNYLTIADLKHQSIREAWDGEQARDARRRHIERDLAGTLCGNCWQGRMDQIQPLNPNHATVVDFPEFYVKTANKTTIRLQPKS
jgi:molybdenum cofactor biosynthesis enzyme MoaA